MNRHEFSKPVGACVFTGSFLPGAQPALTPTVRSCVKARADLFAREVSRVIIQFLDTRPSAATWM